MRQLFLRYLYTMGWFEFFLNACMDTIESGLLQMNIRYTIPGIEEVLLLR